MWLEKRMTNTPHRDFPCISRSGSTFFFIGILGNTTLVFLIAQEIVLLHAKKNFPLKTINDQAVVA